MSITVIGTIYIDIKGFPLSVFDPAGRNAGIIKEYQGGVGRNIAEDIGNIGLRPVFISLCSPGGFGNDVLSRLDQHNVETGYIRQIEGGMGTWLAIFDNDGDVYANISERPDLSPILETLKENCEDIFSSSDGILIEMDMGREIVSYVFEQAEKYGKKIYGVVSNINIALEMKDLILKTDCFICNQQESSIFFAEHKGYENLDKISPEEMLAILPELVRREGLKRMIVTMGSKGSVYAENEGERGICPAENVNVIDTSGAGDAFFAGASVGLSLGKSLKDAAAIGTSMAAGAISSEENTCPPFTPCGL